MRRIEDMTDEEVRAHALAQRRYVRRLLRSLLADSGQSILSETDDQESLLAERTGPSILDDPEVERFAQCDPSELTTRAFVYFLRSEALVKIGVTLYLETRVKGLAASSAVPVRLLGWLTTKPEDGLREEGRAHLAFADRRHHGEWFTLGDDDVRSYLEAHQGTTC